MAYPRHICGHCIEKRFSTVSKFYHSAFVQCIYRTAVNQSASKALLGGYKVLAALGRVRSADTKKLLAHATRSLRSGHACNFFVLLPRLGKKSVVFIIVFSSRRTRPHLLVAA